MTLILWRWAWLLAFLWPHAIHAFSDSYAVAPAFILRSSKAAAAIAVWLSNPITFPVFYLASYKVGTLLFGISAAYDAGGEPVDILKLGAEVTIAAVTGGHHYRPLSGHHDLFYHP